MSRSTVFNPHRVETHPTSINAVTIMSATGNSAHASPIRAWKDGNTHRQATPPKRTVSQMRTAICLKKESMVSFLWVLFTTEIAELTEILFKYDYYKDS
jgi:hypothetical protein